MFAEQFMKLGAKLSTLKGGEGREKIDSLIIWAGMILIGI